MTPIRKSILNYVLGQIVDCKLAAGDRIPTEVDLAKQFNTNRMNAHLAIKRLEREGIVERKKKQGTILCLSYTHDKIIQLRNTSANKIFILTAPVQLSRHIHWDENTLTQFEGALKKNGKTAIYKEFSEDGNNFCGIVEEILKTDSHAIVILPDGKEKVIILDHIDLLTKYKGEIYLLDRGLDSHNNWPFHMISVDPFGEGVLVGKHLLQRNYHNIVYFTGKPNSYYWSEERKKGLSYQITNGQASSMKVPLPVIYYHDKNFENQFDAVINQSSEKPVFVAQNDEYGALLIDFAKRERNLVSPDDFMVIAFDNNPIFRQYNLTTVAPPVEKVGSVLADMICSQQYQRSDGIKISVKLDSHIVERETLLTVKEET